MPTLMLAILTDGYNARIIDGVYTLDQSVIARGTQLLRLLKESEDIIRYFERAVKYGMATEDDKGNLKLGINTACY